MNAFRSPRALVRASLCLLAVLVLASDADAQRRRAKGVRPNDPSTCPYTEGDPERLAAAGIVSLGGFPFGTTDTKAIDEKYPHLDIRWIETPHLRIGLAVPPYSVRNDERAKIEGELKELSAVLPGVPLRPRTIDPWLRAHLFAMRLEKHYARISEVLRVKDEDFPDGTKQWDMKSKFMGRGPYLGQESKYEVLVLPSPAASKQYLSDHFGLQVERTQRWNVRERGAIMLVVPLAEAMTLRDTGLHCHVVFNLTTNLIDGYKSYSYELPVWIREGLAHVMEREVDPSYNSFTYSEGSDGERVTKSDWLAEVRKLVRADAAPSLAQLVHLESYGDMLGPHHLAAWSMSEFLVREHAEAYAEIHDDLHGRVNAQGWTDGSNIRDAHRDAFRERLGMSYAAFDEAWRTWVMSSAAEGRGSGTGRDDEPSGPVPVPGGF